MIPSVLSSQVKRGIDDFLKTTFPVSTPFFHGVMEWFLSEDGGSSKARTSQSSFPIEHLPSDRIFFRASPGAPNLLSCTPTLELGIDIGDLSSVILCSVPPSQANYMQCIGRSGRKNGNAFNFTVANGRPHDLYFYEEPKEMIAGSIEPPGCFLDAPAVLERQMTAFCFDCWIESGIPVTAIPDRLGQVLSNLNDSGNKRKFPFNFISYIELHRNQLLADFTAMFQDSLTDHSREHLHGFVYGATDGKQSLIYSFSGFLASGFSKGFFSALP
jgi:hypothetical protein